MSKSGHLTDYLKTHAHENPDKLALVTEGRSMTWSELWREVSAGAAFLADKLPAESQAKVAILMPNTWQYVVAYLSIVHAGHMAMPIDVIFKPLEIEAVLRQVPPEFLITDAAGAARVSKDIVDIVRVEDFPVEPPKEERPYLRLPVEEQVASLLFTSGTTGKPKVVPNTHRNHIWNIESCSEVWKWTADDTQLINVRLSHMLGLIMGLSGTLYHSSTMYLQDRFNEEETFKLLASGKITMYPHGPLVFARLLEFPDREKYDLSGVRLFMSGSGPLAPAIWQEFKDVFRAEILEVYGTTETGRIASNLLDERIPGSPGRLLPGVEARFDEHGQVMVRSDGVFPGYLGNEEETKAHQASDSFWKTGDIGEMVNGRIVLRGRLKERIRRQGYTVSPRDVEWALHKDRRIKEAYVMGIQHADSANDQVVYFLSGDIDEAEVKRFCAENLPSVWRPDRIFILDKLPRTRTGKPALGVMRAMIN